MVVQRKSEFMKWLDQQPAGTAQKIHDQLYNDFYKLVQDYRGTNQQTYDVIMEQQPQVYKQMRKQALDNNCKRWHGVSKQFIADYKKFICQNNDLYIKYNKII